MPNLRVFSSRAYKSETCLVGLQRSYQHSHNPIFPIGKRHSLMMHCMIETDVRRPKMHPADDGGHLQFGSGREDHRSHNSVIGEVAGTLDSVACFVTHLFG